MDMTIDVDTEAMHKRALGDRNLKATRHQLRWIRSEPRRYGLNAVTSADLTEWIEQRALRYDDVQAFMEGRITYERLMQLRYIWQQRVAEAESRRDLRPLQRQFAWWLEMFPELELPSTRPDETRCCPLADGYLAVPVPEALARTPLISGERRIDTLHPKDYDTAVATVLDLLDVRSKMFGPEHMRLHHATAEAYEKRFFRSEDFYLIQVQSGWLHAGRSVPFVRIHASADQVGLDIYAIACLLLAGAPLRLEEGSLSIDCPGTEYARRDLDDPVGAPVFRCNEVGRISLTWDWTGGPSRESGSATAFVEAA